MATINLTSENFKSTIDDNDVVIIDFWAGWCGPCMRFGPVFENVSTQYDDVVFAKLDTEDQRDVAAALEISSIPTLMAFKGGTLIYREAGALNAKQLESLVEQVKNFDLEAARAQAAAEEK